MAAKGTTFDHDFLLLIFNAIPIANIADNTATSPLTYLQVSLHTSDPTVGGAQNTNEISYTGYARLAVIRTSAGWTVTGASVSPAAIVTYGAMTAGAGGTVTNVSVGTASSGAGKILYTGALSPNIVVTNGTTPQLNTSSVITES